MMPGLAAGRERLRRQSTAKRPGKPQGIIMLDGGRDRDRTCDPLDVNEVLSR
jgi:hypothetical protein